MVVRLAIASTVGAAVWLLTFSANPVPQVEMQKTMIASTERIAQPTEEFRSHALGTDSKAISFAVPQWVQIRMATFSRVDSKSAIIDMELSGDYPSVATGRFAIQVKFPEAKGGALAFVYTGGSYEYNSEPAIKPGQAALVRLKDFQVLSVAKVRTNGQNLTFEVNHTVSELGQPTSLVACYVPPDIDPEKIVGGFEESFVAALRFAPAGSRDRPTAGTLLPKFITRDHRTN